MIRSICILLFFALFHSPVFATNAIQHVIYVTLDGIRWQDIYLDRTHFHKLWTKYANQLTFYGIPNSHSTMEAASIPVSLPSYQTQMAGAVQPCANNQCGRIRVT